ncbi:MAG: zinc-ribbon domain-containing protein [Archangium sp.]|nr:zinc-ribbon domain-containing protein [Archangium sp.]
MDVSCPRCQTEYELDDTRVTEDGVTVKCTSCAHVFRVKKKSLVVTLPVRPGEPPPPPPPSAPEPVGTLPPAPPLREWKLRQPNGNVYPCRDLTMLQKWIIEGKVQRDDEISLTGETWKRLGNIPELASFFQVVDDAAKARSLESMSKSPPVGNAPVQPAAPSGAKPVQGKITDTWRGGTFSAPPPEPVVPVEDAAAETLPPDPPAVRRKPDPMKETLQGGRFSTVPPAAVTTPGGRFSGPPPTANTTPGGRFSSGPPPPLPPPPPPRSSPEPSDDDLRRAVGGGGSGKWIALVIAGLAVGGGVGWYLGVYEPEQQRLAQERASEQARLDEEARVKALQEAASKNPPPVVVDAGVAEVVDSGTPVVDAGALVIDAGVVTPPVVIDAGAPVFDAGAAVAEKPDAGAPEQKKSYEFYLAQGERLREREKATEALNYYGRAHEMKPERVEPLAGRGLCLLDMGNPTAAVAAFEQALALGPRYGPAIMGMAEALRAQGKNEQAIEYYQKYLDVLPNGSEAPVARNSIERLKR